MLGNSGVCHMKPDYKVSVPVSGFVVTVIGRIGLPVDVFAQSSSEWSQIPGRPPQAVHNGLLSMRIS